MNLSRARGLDLWLRGGSLAAAIAVLVTGHPASAQSDKPAQGEGSGLRLEGFFSQTAAYTYASPRHWSNATSRLQLGTRGEFGPGIKWRIGGRIDADPVYMGSDFYRTR